MDESKKFAEWLARFPEPSLKANQSAAIYDVAYHLPNEDVLSCMFNGPDSVALMALNLLRDRYEEDQYWQENYRENTRN